MKNLSEWEYLATALIIAYALLSGYQHLKQANKSTAIAPLLLGNPQVKTWLQNN